VLLHCCCCAAVLLLLRCITAAPVLLLLHCCCCRTAAATIAVLLLLLLLLYCCCCCCTAAAGAVLLLCCCCCAAAVLLPYCCCTTARHFMLAHVAKTYQRTLILQTKCKNAKSHLEAKEANQENHENSIYPNLLRKGPEGNFKNINVLITFGNFLFMEALVTLNPSALYAGPCRKNISKKHWFYKQNAKMQNRILKPKKQTKKNMKTASTQICSGKGPEGNVKNIYFLNTFGCFLLMEALVTLNPSALYAGPCRKDISKNMSFTNKIRKCKIAS